MKYVWILMLVGVDGCWLVSSIADIVKSVRYIKENVGYSSVGDFINDVGNELEESTISFVMLHLFGLFIASLIVWLKFKIGG